MAKTRQKRTLKTRIFSMFLTVKNACKALAYFTRQHFCRVHIPLLEDPLLGSVKICMQTILCEQGFTSFWQ